MEIDFMKMTDREVIELENKYGANHYNQVEDMVVRRADGVWLYTDHGKYLCCLAGYSANNQGYHNSIISSRVIRALEKEYGAVFSNCCYAPARSAFLKKLAEFIPLLGPRFRAANNKIMMKNGGTESVETAIKIARAYGCFKKGITDGDQRIIVAENNFHGRMITVVSASSHSEYNKGFCGFDKKRFPQVNYDDPAAVEREVLSDKNICAILIEPMQGEGGMNVPSKGYLKALRKIADDNNLILMLDEIQVGLGRTGKNFCFEHENIIPDVLILGKAISGGLVPVSCCVTNDYLMRVAFWPGRDGSTYGAYGLACAAGLAALDVIINENLADRAAFVGKNLMKRLKKIAAQSPYVKEVRGQGLFIGIEMKDGDAKKYCAELRKHFVFANDSHGHTIRISPPLIINDDEIDFLVNALEKVLIP